jgi:hypothetical protein
LVAVPEQMRMWPMVLIGYGRKCLVPSILLRKGVHERLSPAGKQLLRSKQRR